MYEGGYALYIYVAGRKRLWKLIYKLEDAMRLSHAMLADNLVQSTCIERVYD